MLRLELVISCVSPIGARAPKMKAWLDPEPELDLDSEYELSLQAVDDSVQRALVELEPTSTYFLYRVGLVADPGAIWQLSIRDLKSGRVLHEDSDLLAVPKEYRIGSCEIAATLSAYASSAELPAQRDGHGHAKDARRPRSNVADRMLKRRSLPQMSPYALASTTT